MPNRKNRSHAGTASGAVLAAIGMALTSVAEPANAAGNAANGQSIYQAKCGGCHSLDANRIGPAHRGVVGRRVASAPGFNYSPALKRVGGVWTPARLDQWLQGPQKFAPGTAMYLTVPDASERSAIIGYLAANSPTAAPSKKAPPKKT